MNFLNRIKSKKENPKTLVNQDEELAQLKSEQMALSATNGKSITANTTLDASINLNEMPAVCQTRGAYQSKGNAIGAIYEQNLSRDLTHYDFLVNDFETNTEYNSIHTDIENILAEQTEAINEATTCHKEDMADKKQEIEDNKDDISNNKTDLNNCKKHNTKLQNAIAVFIIALIWLGEVTLNKDAFSYVGLNVRDAILVGLAISVVTLMLGVAKSYVLRKPDFSILTKILASLGLLVIVVAVYYTLGSIRISMLESSEENDGIFGLSAIHFVFLNLAFYIAIFAAKYFIFSTPEQAKDNADYNEAHKKLKDSQKKEKALKQNVANSYQTKQNIFKKVKTPFSKQLKPLLAKLNAKIDKIINAALTYNTELSRANNFYEQINADYYECVACFLFNINVSGKKDNVQILMSNLDDLTNPFGKYKPISIEKIEALRKPIVSTEKPNKDNGTSEPEKPAKEILSEAQTDKPNDFINSKK